MPTQPQKFPTAKDAFDAVMNNDTVAAVHINDLATAATEIERAAQHVVLTEKPAEYNFQVSRRRKVIFETFKVESAARKDYVDISITLKEMDANGNWVPAVGAWKSSDYAIALDVANISTVPNIPTSYTGSFDSSKSCGQSYTYSIKSYSADGATATVRIYDNNTSEMQPPYMVKVDANNRYIWAICGTSMSDLHIHKWDATSKTYKGGCKLSGIPAGYDTGSLIDNIRDFIPTDQRIYILFRKIRVEQLGKIAAYDSNGVKTSDDWLSRKIYQPDRVGAGTIIAYLNALTAMTADPSGNLYVAGFMRTGGSRTYLTNNNQDNLSAHVFKFDPNGDFLLATSGIGTHTAEDKYVPGNYDHRFGNGFKWSWCFGLSYCNTDGYIYGAFNASHRTDSNGLNGHCYVIRFNTQLVKVWDDYQHLTLDGYNRQLGQLMAYKGSGKTYIYCLHPFSDYGNNITYKDAPVVSTLEAFSNYPNHRIYRWYYSLPTDYGAENVLTSAGFDIIVDQMGNQLGSSNNNLVTGITISNDGLVYYCTSKGTDRIHCVEWANAFDRTPLTVPSSQIKAIIRMTVVTAADPANDLKGNDSGNLAENGQFTAGTTGWIYDKIPAPTDRIASMLRDKPAKPIDGAGSSGWGFMHVDDPAVWRDSGADEILADAVTDPYGPPDSSSGVTCVTTGAAAVTKTQLGYIQDASQHQLYIPGIWFGDNIGSGKLIVDAYDLIDYAMSDQFGPDTVPVYRNATGSIEVKGSWGVPVMEVPMPRTWQSGDFLKLSLNYSMHLLDTVQNMDYDRRLMRCYVFMMFLDGTHKPILPVSPNYYSDGNPVYRLDWWTDGLDTNTLIPGATYVGSTLSSSHKYQRYASSLLKSNNTQNPASAVPVPVPEGTTRIRIGFVPAIYSSNRNDNILTYTGESGGMYVDDISLILDNPANV